MLLAYPVAPEEPAILRRTMTGASWAEFMTVLLCIRMNESRAGLDVPSLPPYDPGATIVITDADGGSPQSIAGAQALVWSPIAWSSSRHYRRMGIP